MGMRAIATNTPGATHAYNQRTKRRNGNNDLRLLPAAITIWAATLATQLAGAQSSANGSNTHSNMLLACCGGCTVMALLAIMYLTHAHPHPQGAAMRMPAIACTLTVVCFAALAGTFTSLAWQYRTASDIASQLTANASSTQVHVNFQVRSMPVASTTREYDCQVDALTISVESSDLLEPSHIGMRVFMRNEACSTIMQNGTYRAQGRIRTARYGREPVWLETSMAVETVSEPSMFWRALHSMRTAFFSQTSRLDDQGSILVPGVTLGVLGQNIVTPAGQTQVEEQYAQQLQDRCKRAGIMHLMAVSGGHYTLVHKLVMLLCATLGCSRPVKTVALAGAYLCLTAMLPPNESVTRANLMAMIALGYLMLGRRRQSIHLLSLTAIVALLFDPSLAASIGFALSCSAVLGLSLMCRPLSQRLEQHLPATLARAISASICAQAFAMPIQLLMSNEIPIYSLPANLLVAPFVDIATMLGLGALLLAWCAPSIAYALAWASSACTRAIAVAADTFGAGDSSTLPWMEGATGIVMLVIAQLTFYAICMGIRAWVNAYDAWRTGTDGKQIRASITQRVIGWFSQTLAMIRDITWASQHRSKR